MEAALENGVCSVVKGVWNDFLGIAVERSAQVTMEPEEGTGLTGCVQFTGAWTGTLLLECPLELGRQVAAVMFPQAPDSLTMEQSQDAIGELTNMIGGNLKALLPSPCRIGLPTILEEASGSRSVPGERLISRLGFQCQGQPFVVTLLQRDESFSRADSGDTRRREFIRVAAHFEAVLRSVRKAVTGGPIHDVSIKGFSCRCQKPFPVGTDCHVTLLLGEPEDSVGVNARARVVRASHDLMAVEFTEMDPASYHHLRNLVLHHAADSDQAEGEIKSHLGLKSR